MGIDITCVECNRTVSTESFADEPYCSDCVEGYRDRAVAAEAELERVRSRPVEAEGTDRAIWCWLMGIERVRARLQEEKETIDCKDKRQRERFGDLVTARMDLARARDWLISELDRQWFEVDK